MKRFRKPHCRRGWLCNKSTTMYHAWVSSITRPIDSVSSMGSVENDFWTIEKLERPCCSIWCPIKKERPSPWDRSFARRLRKFVAKAREPREGKRTLVRVREWNFYREFRNNSPRTRRMLNVRLVSFHCPIHLVNRAATSVYSPTALPTTFAVAAKKSASKNQLSSAANQFHIFSFANFISPPLAATPGRGGAASLAVISNL